MEVSFTDNLSGVHHIQVWFDHPIRDGVRLAIGSGSDPGWLVAGTNKNGTFRFAVQFPPFAATGDWVFSRLSATDYAGNFLNILEAEIASRGFPTKMSVTSASSNQPPTANAGSDQTVTSGQLVTLTGSGSDPEGQAMTFTWTQIQGPTVSMGNSNSATASFTAPQITASTVLRFRLTVSDGSLTTEAFVNITVNPASSPTIFFAQFANGAGTTSDIVLTNPSATTVTGTLEMYDDNGGALSTGFIGAGQQSRLPFFLPPYGAITFGTDGQGSLATGSARVVSSGTLGGVIRFAIPGIGIAGVGDSQAFTGAIVPVRRRANEIDTGVAITAVGDGGTLTLTLRNYSGTQVAATSLTLTTNGHMARFIDELFPGVDTSDFDGTLTVTASGASRVAIVGLELGNVPGQFTTLPVTSLR
jgi:hypothetical protein